jgi:hypothetical protein
LLSSPNCKKEFRPKLATLSIQLTIDSPTAIPARKVFPQCICKTEPTNWQQLLAWCLLILVFNLMSWCTDDQVMTFGSLL